MVSPLKARPLGVLMVCLGNICRSPMAEGVLRARLQEAGLAAKVHVDSAANRPFARGSSAG